MSAVRLKYLARLNTDCEGVQPKPIVTLENIDSWVGSLVDGVELPVKDPIATAGIATVEPGDVLFGKLRPYLAKTWLSDRQAYASTELLCLRPASGVNSKWLAYLMSSRPVVDWAIASSDGTKMPRTSWEALGEFRVTLPSESDQEGIARFLERETARIDALIAAKRRLVDLLGERFSVGVSSLLELSALASSRRLGAFAEVVLGRQRSPEHESGPFMTRYLRAANVKDGALDLTDVKEMNFRPREQSTFRLIPGDILISEGAGSLAAVGTNAVWKADLSGTVCFQNTLLRLRPREGTDPEYLAWWCRGAYYGGLFAAIAAGANIFHLSAERLKSVPCGMPPIAAQRNRCLQLRKIESAWSAAAIVLNRQVELLLEHRRALVSAAVTGELNIPGVVAA